MKSRALLILLLSFLLADLVLIASGLQEFRWWTKPFLMPILLGYFWFLTIEKKKIRNNYLIFAILFSFLGDVFLLFQNGILFGLAEFLLAHIFYCLIFYRKKQGNRRFDFLAVILIYLIFLLSFLWNSLGSMQIPVVVYALTVATMLYFALCTKNRLLAVGALLFVISDSALSVELFKHQAVFLRLLVMLTYVLGQLFLVKGIVETSKAITTQNVCEQ